MTDFVGKYAELSLAADTFRSAGLPVPFDLSQAIQRFEERAKQVFTPQQMQSALNHVEAAKVRILSEEQARDRLQIADKADDLMGSLTSGMYGHAEGLTQEQFNALKQGKPVRFKSTQEHFDAKAASNKVRQQTKRLDPNGKGYGLKEWESRLEALVNADDVRFKSLAKEYSTSEDEVRQLADKWRGERYSYEARKRSASPSPPKDEVHKPTDEQQRRATVIDAYVNTVDTENDDEMNQLFDGVSSPSLEDEGMRGDIARAFVEVEERDDAA